MSELKELEESVKGIIAGLNKLKQEIKKVIVGQEEIIDQLLITFLAGGHALLEGVPGLAKTLMIRSLSEAIELKIQAHSVYARFNANRYYWNGNSGGGSHNRVSAFFNSTEDQFSPILFWPMKSTALSPKTQAALLEAMQEFSVTYAGVTYPLERPFFILATQNPIEQAGTFPLPEAQLDRFLLYIKVNYPTAEEERAILESTTGKRPAAIQHVLEGSKILEAQKLVRDVHINGEIVEWVSNLVRATRANHSEVKFVKDWVRWGAGPRAGQAMILTAKARALLSGRFAVTQEDIRHVAYPVLRHRILMNFKAESEGVISDDVTTHLLENISIRKGI
jgi:MoxR-like ATPase